MPAKDILTALLIIVAPALGGCTSTPPGDAFIEVPATVRQPDELDERVAPYYYQFVSAIEEKGFRVGPTDDPNALQLDFDFQKNRWSPELAVTLTHDRAELINVQGRFNSSGGVSENRTYETLNRRALSHFQRELDTLSARLVITDP